MAGGIAGRTGAPMSKQGADSSGARSLSASLPAVQRLSPFSSGPPCWMLVARERYNLEIITINDPSQQGQHGQLLRLKPEREKRG